MEKAKVLAICLNRIPSALIGVIEPLKRLEGEVIFKFVETLKVTKKDIAEADVVITIRGSEEIELQIIKECKRLKKYVIYFTDDDLLNIPKIASCFEYFNNVNVRNNIKSIMQKSDCLWTTNKNIEAKYKEFFGKTVLVNAPALSLNFEEKSRKYNGEKINIIFSGGIDHKFFLETFLKEPVMKIIRKYKERVDFTFFGVKPSFLSGDNIIFIPYESDYDEYKKIINSGKWDIGLAPLQDSEFNKCKYFNKYLEYGAANIAGIYSNVEPFTHIIKNEQNGILAENNSEDWVKAISLLIEKEELRISISKNAKDQLREHFTPESVAQDLVVKIPEIVNFKAKEYNEKDVRLLCMGNNSFIYKLYNLFKREGIRTFGCLLKKLLKKMGIKD